MIINTSKVVDSKILRNPLTKNVELTGVSPSKDKTTPVVASYRQLRDARKLPKECSEFGSVHFIPGIRASRGRSRLLGKRKMADGRREARAARLLRYNFSRAEHLDRNLERVAKYSPRMPFKRDAGIDEESQKPAYPVEPTWKRTVETMVSRIVQR